MKGRVNISGRVLEYRVSNCSRRLARELPTVFTAMSALRPPFTIISTFQPSAVDLVDWGDEAAREKDALLKIFVQWARAICQRLTAQGHWADAVEPSSGLPLDSAAGPSIFDEVEVACSLFGLAVHQAAGCALVSHPEWGTACYPASIVTNAPQETVFAAIAETQQQQPDPRSG